MNVLGRFISKAGMVLSKITRLPLQFMKKIVTQRRIINSVETSPVCTRTDLLEQSMTIKLTICTNKLARAEIWKVVINKENICKKADLGLLQKKQL